MSLLHNDPLSPALAACQQPDVIAFKPARGNLPRRSIKVPSGWFAMLASPDGCQSLASPSDPLDTRDISHIVLARETGLECSASIPCRAQSGHNIDAKLILDVRVHRTASDVYACFKTLLANSAVLTSRDIERALDCNGIPAAVRAFVAGHPADRLVDGQLSSEVQTHALNILKRFDFTNGLLSRVKSVEFTSTELDRERQTQAKHALQCCEIRRQSELSKLQSEIAIEKLGRLRILFDEMVLTAARTGTSISEVIRALPYQQRTAILRNYWQLRPIIEHAQEAVVVAGTSCIWLSANEREPQLLIEKTLAGLGPLRSVTYDPVSGSIMVGALQGVFMLDAESGEERCRFVAPHNGQTKTGFNSIVLSNNELYAAHSILGLYRWNISEPGTGVQCIVPPPALEGLRSLIMGPNGSLYFGYGREIHSIAPGDNESNAIISLSDAVMSLAFCGNSLFAGTLDGHVQQVLLDNRPCFEHLCNLSSQLESMHGRNWGNFPELLVPGGNSGVISVFPEERTFSAIAAETHETRDLCACDDLVVGVSNLRNTLVFLRAGEDTAQAVTLNIKRLSGHAVQDVCLITEHSGNDAVVLPD